MCWFSSGNLPRKSPCSVRMRENTDQKNSEYGQFLRSQLRKRWKYRKAYECHKSYKKFIDSKIWRLDLILIHYLSIFFFFASVIFPKINWGTLWLVQKSLVNVLTMSWQKKRDFQVFIENKNVKRFFVSVLTHFYKLLNLLRILLFLVRVNLRLCWKNLR